jgi:hypothetical protein
VTELIELQLRSRFQQADTMKVKGLVQPTKVNHDLLCMYSSMYTLTLQGGKWCMRLYYYPVR